MVAGPVELDRLPCDQQERRPGIMIADRLAQVGEGMAQIAARVGLGGIRPELSGQLLAAMGSIWMQQQTGEEGLSGARGDDDRLVVHADFVPPQ